jgi:hypothetical protein
MPSISRPDTAAACRRTPALVQEHEINVAVRIQLRAAKTADGHQRDRRKFLLRRRGDWPSPRPQMAQQRVQHRRAGLADFAAVRAGAVLQLEPVRLDLEKFFVARELFRRVALGEKDRRASAAASIFLSRSCTGAKVNVLKPPPPAKPCRAPGFQ